jgi:hypothetical protein
MNAEATVLDQKRSRYEDYLPREGFAEIELTSEDFRAILNDAMPGGEWPANVIDAVVDELRDHLARANGQFGWSSFNTKRGDLRERLDLLRGSLKTAAYILASSGDLQREDRRRSSQFHYECCDRGGSGFDAVGREAEICRRARANQPYLSASRDGCRSFGRNQRRRPGPGSLVRPYRRGGRCRRSKPGNPSNDRRRPRR